MTDIKQQAIDIAKILIDHGYVTYLAGGCVRDSILGKGPKDYDIATEATPDQILELFPDADTIGAHFGVIMVKDQGEMFEIATFRTDGSYSDNRRPDSVEFATAEEDCNRRDFTINGIFECPVTGDRIDHVGGESDLANQTVRCIGNASDRFSEDALRMIRAVRFATVLNFGIENETYDAIIKHRELIHNVSVERINVELVKILESPNRTHGIRILKYTGLLRAYVDIDETVINSFQHIKEVVDLTVCLAVLFGSSSSSKTVEQDLLALRFPNKIVTDVLKILEAPVLVVQFPDKPLHWQKRFYATPHAERQVQYYNITRRFLKYPLGALFFVWSFRNNIETCIIPKPLLDGNDLIKLGYKAGVEFSRILTAVQNLQLDGDLTTKEQAVEWLQN